MDTRTGLVIATLMTLLNGGVLGMMHKSLSPDVQPSASDWRIGFLLFAGGSILLAFQDLVPMGLVLPVANGCMLVGVMLYWRSTRRFMGQPDTPWLFAPLSVAIAGVYWFAAQTPDQAMRVYFATSVWLLGVFGAAWTLLRSLRHRELHSRTVLAGAFVLAGSFLLLRGLSFVIHPDRQATLLQSTNIFNLLTPLIVTVLPVIGATAFLVMCSERIRNQWQRAAATDYLTELPNSRTIIGSGEAGFKQAQRLQTGFAAAVIDIDHFKRINDGYDHDAGDVALKHVARLLAEHCRGPHLVGRQGGEEFVALLAVANTQEAITAAERLRHAVEAAPVHISGEPVRLTISIGVAVLTATDLTYDHLLRRADQAVYAAKAGGRNRVVLAAVEG